MLLACALTVALETGFFLIIGYIDKPFIAMCICANVITNLTLNLLITVLYRFGADISVAVYPLEILAVAAEYVLYSLIKRRSWSLFLLTLAANVISYCAGLAIFGSV